MSPRTRIEPCRVAHKTRAARARCEWPYAASIAGEGRWAVIVWCGPVMVHLYERHDQAAAALARLDQPGGCSDPCRHAHRLVDLDWPHRAWTSKLARR